MTKFNTAWITLTIAFVLASPRGLSASATEQQTIKAAAHSSRLLVIHHKNQLVLDSLEREFAVELQLVLDDTEVSLFAAPSLWYTADSLNESERLFEMLAICQDQQAGAVIELASRGDAVEQLRVVVILPSGAIGRSVTLPTPVDRPENLALVTQGLLDEALLFEQYRQERGADDPNASERTDWTNLVSLTPPPEPEKIIQPADRVSILALGGTSLAASEHEGSASWFGGDLLLRVALIGDLHGVIDLAFQGGRLRPTADNLHLSGWRLWPGVGLDYDWRWNRFGLELYALGVFPWTLLELSQDGGSSSTTTFWGVRLDAGAGGRWFFHERMGLVLRTGIGVNTYRDTLENASTGEIVFQNPLLEWSASMGLEYYLL